MPDINWGGDAAGAPFTSRLDDESGNLILAETDTGTALFEWDGGAWQFRGPVEMNGEDVSGIESLTATSGNFDSVNTDEQTTGRSSTVAFLSSIQSVPHDSQERVALDETTIDQLDAFDPANNVYVAPTDGTYTASAQVRIGEEIDERLLLSIGVNGENQSRLRPTSSGEILIGSQTWWQVASYDFELSAGDELSFNILQRNTASDAIDIISGDANTWFRVRRC